MKKYEASAIRNICLLSHGGVGKTSLMEALCYTAKATKKIGKVDNGSSIFDNRSDEKERKMTISMAVGSLEWKETKINLLDTPGFLDFQGDIRAALQVVESAAILVDAASGMQVGTEQVARLADEAKMPKFFILNGMDRENANFEKVYNALKEAFGPAVAALQMPIGAGVHFRGVIDIITKEAFEYQTDGEGLGKKIDIPADMVDLVETTRGEFMEAVAGSDEGLMNTFCEAGELSVADLRKGLSKGMAEGTIFPLLCSCAVKNMGVDCILDVMKELCPSAESRTEVKVMENEAEKKIPCLPNNPPAAFIFKTISEEHVGELNIVRVFSGKLTTGLDLYNPSHSNPERLGNMYFMRGKEKVDTTEIAAGDIGGLLKLKDTHTNDTLSEKSHKFVFPKTNFPTPLVSVAITSKNKGDEDKIAIGINKLREEDPTFTYGYQADIRQSILSAMGDIHIEVILQNLKNRFKVEVDRKQPKVSYRETITKSAKYVEYTHKKQTGGAGQYGRVFIDLEPRARGEGYEFVDKIVGGVIDQSLRPSVDKGVRSKLDEGFLAGYPIVDLKVTLVDGKTHPVDSKDIAFQIAGREAFKKAFEMCSPILLEPIVDLKVTVPEDHMGDVMGDLSSRRGKIGGMEAIGKYQVINAKVPESEIQNYSASLRSITQGRGYFLKHFSHYDPVPGEVAKKIIEAHKAEKVGTVVEE
jgi:elongation factor G